MCKTGGCWLWKNFCSGLPHWHAGIHGRWAPHRLGFAWWGKTTVFATWIWLHPGPGPSQGGSNTVRPLMGANILNMPIWMDMGWIEIILILKVSKSVWVLSVVFVCFCAANFMARLSQPLFRLSQRYGLQLWDSLQNFHFGELVKFRGSNAIFSFATTSIITIFHRAEIHCAHCKLLDMYLDVNPAVFVSPKLQNWWQAGPRTKICLKSRNLVKIQTSGCEAWSELKSRYLIINHKSWKHFLLAPTRAR